VTAQSSLGQLSIPYTMITNKKSCQAYLAGEPYPEKRQIGRYLAKEGVNLPNSLTEDITGFSLRPKYSYEQLRRITRLKIHIKYGHSGGNLKALEGPERIGHGNRQMRIRKALAEEGLF
jgi:hypothetical protein